jgi:hypothetical protein
MTCLMLALGHFAVLYAIDTVRIFSVRHLTSLGAKIGAGCGLSAIILSYNALNYVINTLYADRTHRIYQYLKICPVKSYSSLSTFKRL